MQESDVVVLVSHIASVLAKLSITHNGVVLLLLYWWTQYPAKLFRSAVRKSLNCFIQMVLYSLIIREIQLSHIQVSSTHSNIDAANWNLAVIRIVLESAEEEDRMTTIDAFQIVTGMFSFGNRIGWQVEDWLNEI